MAWLDEHPEVHSLRCAAADLNGQARGKRLPRRLAYKTMAEGTRFPLSVMNLDILGEDIEDSPLVFATGDADGLLLPTERGLVPMPWLDAPSALLPLWMFNADGTPFGGDPRHALAGILSRLAERDLTPVVATELEFYLIDDSGKTLRPPRSPRSGKRRAGGEILSIRTLDAFDDFFVDLYDACSAMEIPAEATSSEVGCGQFEVNIEHQPDAMRTADNTWLFKMLVHGLARKHGMAASFLAKPYPKDAGNGLHTHVSLLNADGQNAFAADPALLSAAVAGGLATMAEATLIFAPFRNSYARLTPGAHAPTAIAWADENRTVSLRLPTAHPQARRIEHRVAGGDVNPYLFLAAVLGGMLIGIEDGLTPPDPITGNAYAQDLPQIPSDWDTARSLFATSAAMARLFPAQLIDNLDRTKRQEQARFEALDAEAEVRLLLDRV